MLENLGIEIVHADLEQPDTSVCIRPLPQTDGVNTFALSFAQQRLWFIAQFQPNNSADSMV